MVDFELGEEQQMLRDTVEAFARDEIRPVARTADEDGVVPPEGWLWTMMKAPAPSASAHFNTSRG